MDYIEKIKKSFEERGYEILLILNGIMYMLYKGDVVEFTLFWTLISIFFSFSRKLKQGENNVKQINQRDWRYWG